MDKKLLFMFGRPFSPLYGALMRARALCYQKGLFRSECFPVPVISVGNLTLGGTGKTPMVQYLARLLQENGFKPAVVSRGYGGATKKPVNVVSDGEQVLLSAEFAGDEPCLLAETLPGVPVLTGVVRKLPARRAVKMGADVLLLDDGFQHLAVQRDLDLVLFSADHLAGNSRIFPGGDLREPVSALGRCSCFVLTGVNEANRERSSQFAEVLRERFPGKDVFMVKNMAVGYVQRDNNRFTVVKEKPVELDKAFAVCGIARPDSFKGTLADCGINPLYFHALSDHHVYKDSDVRRIADRVNKSGARCVVTTEKDMVKFGTVDFGVPVYGVRMMVQTDEQLKSLTIEMVREVMAGKPTI
jgi:tetraacyldisaccharide 4'-kinase